MSLRISSVTPVTPLESPDSLSNQKDSSFKNVLSSAIDEVEGSRADAKQSIDKFLSGQGEDLHSTILASQRADLEFQLFLQMRNKVVSAYQEIMKMQL